MNYNSPKEISEILELRGFSPQKKYGQNFLVSKNVREQILSLIDVKPGHKIWEIGPGLGSVTSLLSESLSEGKLTVFEIDRGFASFLRDSFRDSIEIVEGDMLKTWKKYRDENGMPDRIFGNLPYNAAAVMITTLIEEKAVPEKMVFTIQKEVAQRMIAPPGCREYSSFSVICRVACDIKIEADIQGGAFYPVPDVTSSIISMTPHSLYSSLENRKKFSQFLRILFNSRRKTVLNNLKVFGKDKADEALERAGISPGIRADNLDVGQIVSLYEKVYS